MKVKEVLQSLVLFGLMYLAFSYGVHHGCHSIS